MDPVCCREGEAEWVARHLFSLRDLDDSIHINDGLRHSLRLAIFTKEKKCAHYVKNTVDQQQ